MISGFSHCWRQQSQSAWTHVCIMTGRCCPLLGVWINWSLGRGLTWGCFHSPQCRFGSGPTNLGPLWLGYLRNVWKVKMAWEEDIGQIFCVQWRLSSALIAQYRSTQSYLEHFWYTEEDYHIIHNFPPIFHNLFSGCFQSCMEGKTRKISRNLELREIWKKGTTTGGFQPC